MKTHISYFAGSLALVVGLFCVSRIEAQTKTVSVAAALSHSALINSSVRGVNDYFSVLTQKMAADRLKAMNENRQRHLISDADKLVGLATDLHHEMQSDREMTSIDLSRRAAEIERLAHELEDRMKSF